MGCPDGGWAEWNAEGAGWGGAGAGVDGTKPIWGEVVWGDGVRDGGPAGWTGGGAAEVGRGGVWREESNLGVRCLGVRELGRGAGGFGGGGGVGGEAGARRRLR